MKKLILSVFAILSLGFAQAQTLYIATGSNSAAGQLFTVDPGNGNSTLVGNILVGASPIGITGLAFNPLDGVLFGVTTSGSPNFAKSLVTLNTTTAAATLIGTLTHTVSDIAFDSSGTLYAWGTNGPLGTISLSSAAIANIGSGSLANGAGGLAFTSVGTLFLANSESGNINTVNPATGVVTPGSALSGGPFSGIGAVNSMSFDGSNMLFAVDSDREGPASTKLVTINTTTGAITSLGDLPVNSDAIAFSVTPVPEPSAYAAAVGVIALGWVAFRRRARR